MSIPTDLTGGEKSRLLRSVGLAPDATLAEELLACLADAAPLYAFDEAVSRRLFFLCLKRELLDLVTGDYWKEFSTQYGDEKESKDQQFTHLRAMRTDCIADIETLREQIALGGGYAHGDMVHTTPVDAPAWRPNPSDRAYGGDPLRRTILRDGFDGFGEGFR